MGAKVITITSGKGGVGKTTTTANLGVALANSGQRVACVDADIGLRNLDVVMGLENRIVYDIVDVVEGRARLRQAMIRDKRLPELSLLPAAQTRDKSAVTPAEMVQLVDDMRADFFELGRPTDIGFFVEAGHELDDDGDFLAVLRGAQQRLHEHRIRTGAVDRHLDGDNLRIGRRLID